MSDEEVREMGRKGERAVVLGGSMAGLMTARVLADRFDEVVVVERDRLSEAGEHRTGVPQSRHTHGLLCSGSRVIEELYPGIGEALETEGVGRGDTGAECRWILGGRALAKVETGLRGMGVSRPALERQVRARTLGLANVTVLEGHAARGLQADGGRVTGARVAERGGDGDDRLLHADLVVDASGRGSKVERWLADLGYAPPPAEKVTVGVRYATRVYRRRPGDLDGDRLVLVAAVPPNPRMGIALGVEGDRWTVTLAGLLGCEPPLDGDGFLAFARALPAPDLHDLIAPAEPLGPAVRTRYPAHHRRRFERARALPDGLLVVGDALCSFNPTYGQGMSVAAQEAMVLAACLDDGGLDGLPRRFFPRAAKLVDAPWEIAVGSDLRYPGVDGPRSVRRRLVNRYVARLHRVAAGDPVVADAFLHVSNLVAPPPSLLRPAIARRVLRGPRTQPAPAPARLSPAITGQG